MTFCRTQGSGDATEQEEDDQTADDPRHDGEIKIVDVGFAPSGSDEGSLLIAAFVGHEIREAAGREEAKAIDKQGTSEKSAIDFLNGTGLFATAIADHRNKRKDGGKERDKRHNGELSGKELEVRNGLGEEDGEDTRDSNASIHGEEELRNQRHLRVLVHVVTVHFDKGDGDGDRDNEGDDKEESNREAEVAVIEVRGGQAIEPSAIEEKEESDEEAKSDVARDRVADRNVIVSVHHAADRIEKAKPGKDRSRNAKSAKFPSKSKAKIGEVDRANLANHERGDKNAGPNA